MKDKFNAKSICAPICPKCGEAMVCVGEKWRLGRRGKFDKVEKRAKKAKLGMYCFTIPK